MNRFVFLSLIIAGVLGVDNVVPDDHDLSVQIGEAKTVIFRTATHYNNIVIVFNNSDYVNLPNNCTIKNGECALYVVGKSPTFDYILEATDCLPANNFTCPLNLTDAYLRLTVYKSEDLTRIVELVGWAYFLAWSISFYPQIFLNIRRKSVIGLNFDFLLLNIIGFSAYTLYNLLIYYNAHVQKEYEELHPRSPIPVLLNDVVFAVHALIACLVTGAQCFVYERENQRVSRPCFLLAGLLILGGTISGFLSVVNVYNALTFVNSLSYIKMIVTLCKYFPQAIYNFTRKSTVGWSIGNVLLDFTGGTLDILQMVLQAVNFDDWSGFYGNPVKFGLGLVSICFDIVFILQHYVLYRYVEVAHNEYSGIDNPEAQSEVSDYGSNENLPSVRSFPSEA